jgi:hypothetical protein
MVDYGFGRSSFGRTDIVCDIIQFVFGPRRY